MTGKIVVRIVSVLVLILAIGGIAFFAYQAGIAQGSPVTIQGPAGQVAPAPYPYFGYGMPFHPFGFGFGCLSPLLALLLVFVALRSFRLLFWGPRWGWGGHGPWRHGWGERGVPPMVEEWHRKMHEEATEEKKE